MDYQGSARYFLGANSKAGFASLYEGFTRPEAGEFLWVIKGGPGCGKSTFMRRIGRAAEAAGAPVEYILCSGDPDSLDGVWLPSLGVGYVDGTAPHVQEAAYPGAAGLYLDLGQFLNPAALRSRLGELADLNRRYKALYADAYALFAAGAALLPKNLPTLAPGPETLARLEKRAAGLAGRTLPRLRKSAGEKRRFLSAWSCRGRVVLWDTLAAYDRVWALENRLGLAHLFLEALDRHAAARGYDRVLCPDPLEPEKPEALLLPEAGLAVLALDRAPGAEAFPFTRRLRLDALADSAALAESRETIRARRRDSAALLSAAGDTLARAKALHDELEAVYRPHVDFAGSAALAEAHIRRLFGPGAEI